MDILNPDLPFIWPAPEVIEGAAEYGQQPAFASQMLSAAWLFGIISGLRHQGIAAIAEWMTANQALKASLIVVVYPACGVLPSDLAELRRLLESHPDRLNARVLPLAKVTDRSMNALCFCHYPNVYTMMLGSTQNLGLEEWAPAQLNFGFQAVPSLVDAFRRHFDWLWAAAANVSLPTVAAIPELVLPPGSQDAAQQWQLYRDAIHPASMQQTPPAKDNQNHTSTAGIPPNPPAEGAAPSPTDRIGVKALDELADFMSKLYEKGSLVSIDKLSRVAPLDAPIDPALFGDSSELKSGSVTRKINLRVSVIDPGVLKEVEKCRSMMRTVLTRFSFALGDSIRWMPNAARGLFERELQQASVAGSGLIINLLKGGVDTFITSKSKKLEDDLKGLYLQLGRDGRVPEHVIETVTTNLKERLIKAQSLSFLPELSYSSIVFSAAESNFSSPWGQSFSLLSDIATCQRKARTEAFFSSSIKHTSMEEFIQCMNVADDVLAHRPLDWKTRDRCKQELSLITKIERAAISSRNRCLYVREIIQGCELDELEQKIEAAG